MQIAQQTAILFVGLLIFIFAGHLGRFREQMRQSLNSQSPIPLSGGMGTGFYTWLIRVVGVILIAGAVYGLLKHVVR
jgi:hypothetical protein